MKNEKETPITGKEGAAIKLDVAANWTKNYRRKHPGETISQFFGKEILESILAQEGCLGIRFYYAYDDEGKRHLIITGVMSNGADQLHAEAFESDSVKAPSAEKAAVPVKPKVYTVGEMSAPCPGSPGCPTNALTGGDTE